MWCLGHGFNERWLRDRRRGVGSCRHETSGHTIVARRAMDWVGLGLAGQSEPGLLQDFVLVALYGQRMIIPFPREGYP